MAQPEIPKKCKAGVVVNIGPDFHLEVQDVDVPEPGINIPCQRQRDVATVLILKRRTKRPSRQAQLYWSMYVRCPLHAQRPPIAGPNGRNGRSQSRS